jgi:hypothetical protein
MGIGVGIVAITPGRRFLRHCGGQGITEPCGMKENAFLPGPNIYSWSSEGTKWVGIVTQTYKQSFGLKLAQQKFFPFLSRTKCLPMIDEEGEMRR